MASHQGQSPRFQDKDINILRENSCAEVSGRIPTGVRSVDSGWPGPPGNGCSAGDGHPGVGDGNMTFCFPLRHLSLTSEILGGKPRQARAFNTQHASSHCLWGTGGEMGLCTGSWHCVPQSLGSPGGWPGCSAHAGSWGFHAHTPVLTAAWAGHGAGGLGPTLRMRNLRCKRLAALPGATQASWRAGTGGLSPCLALGNPSSQTTWEVGAP